MSDTNRPLALDSPTTRSPSAGAYPAQGTSVQAGWLTLAVILSGAFIVVLDFFIVMVALPSIEADLAATTSQLQLVVSAYGVANAAGLITGGRLGDRFGRRRMFILGLFLFVLTSLACAAAPSALLLILARVAQGLAGALLQPQVLAMLGVLYTGSARNSAFAAYAITMGAAGVLGQLIGGALLQADLGGLGWRVCFLINLPIGLAGLALCRRAVPSRPRDGGSRIDLLGMLLVALALTAVVAPLVEGRQQGWPLWSLVCLVSAAPLTLLLWTQQKRLARRGGQPVLTPSLMQQSSYASALLVVLLFYAGTASFHFVLAIYLQQGLGLPPLAAGALFAVVGVGFFATSVLAGRLAALFGQRVLLAGALLLACAHGMQTLLLLSPLGGRVELMLPFLLLQGAGLGMVMGPLASAALAGVPALHAGVASGLLGTAQQVGNSVGVALVGLLFYGTLSRGSDAPASATAFAMSLAYLAALALLLAVLLTRRNRRISTLRTSG